MLATIRTAAFVFTAAATALAGAGSANAASLGETRSVEVRHGDLDLASAQGATSLERRVRAAVRSVCGNADTRDLAARQQIRTCRAAALASAQPRMELAIANARSNTKLAQNDQAPSIHVATH